MLNSHSKKISSCDEAAVVAERQAWLARRVFCRIRGLISLTHLPQLVRTGRQTPSFPGFCSSHLVPPYGTQPMGVADWPLEGGVEEKEAQASMLSASQHWIARDHLLFCFSSLGVVAVSAW